MYGVACAKDGYERLVEPVCAAWVGWNAFNGACRSKQNRAVNAGVVGENISWRCAGCGRGRRAGLAFARGYGRAGRKFAIGAGAAHGGAIRAELRFLRAGHARFLGLGYIPIPADQDYDCNSDKSQCYGFIHISPL